MKEHTKQQEARHRNETKAIQSSGMLAASMQSRKLSQLTQTAYASIARKFRDQYGEEAFRVLAKSAFKDADVNGSGTIDTAELRTILQSCGITIEDDGTAAAVLSFYDVDANGHIDQIEWLKIVQELLQGDIHNGKSKAPLTYDKGTKASPYEPLKPTPKTEMELLRAQVDELREANEEQAKTIASLSKKLAAANDAFKSVGEQHEAYKNKLEEVSKRLASIERRPPSPGPNQKMNSK